MTIEEIIFHFDNTFRGDPWYGKSIFEILSGLNLVVFTARTSAATGFWPTVDFF